MSALWWVKVVLRLLEVSWWEGLVPSCWWVELGLILLVGRAVSRGVFIGGCELSMTLGTLSADGWICVSLLLVVRQLLAFNCTSFMSYSKETSLAHIKLWFVWFF